MAVVELLNKKIDELNKILEDLKDSNLNEKESLEAKLIILQECEKILLNEDLMLTYDFQSVISVLNEQDLSIDNIEKMLNEIKQVINVKKSINNLALPFSDNQSVILNKLKENLSIAQANLKNQISEISKNEVNKDIIEDLNDLKSILVGTGKRKYYTEDMIKSFINVVDWDNLSNEEFDEIIKDFYQTKNLQSKQKKEKETIENVIALYKEFFDEREFIEYDAAKHTGLLKHILLKYSNLVTSSIDMDNTREILQFFKDENILKKFNRNAVFKVSLFANIDYVKTLYEKMKLEHPNAMDVIYEDATASIWILDSSKSTYKKTSFRTTKNQSQKEKEEASLYSDSHSVTYEEFWENVEYLNRNSEMFSEKYDAANFGAHLKTKTISIYEIKQNKGLIELLSKSRWIFVKNMENFKTFELGQFYKIPITSLTQGNVENKIHLAIELGLLNPPMNEIYRELEKDITTNDAFNRNKSHNIISNNSIRNYFQRNTSVLSSTEINDYGYLTYKLNKLGPIGFYNYFFHSEKAGQMDRYNIDRDKKRNMPNKDEFIMNNFVTDFYDQLIENYTEYDIAISNYNEEQKNDIQENAPYFDNSIFEEDIIKDLENNHCIIDSLTQEADMVSIKNEFLYNFGDKLISRYKVLKNASILRNKYGELTEDMLITSIVRNSFITEDQFDVICRSIKERNVIR